jgi:hypothetical protein
VSFVVPDGVSYVRLCTTDTVYNQVAAHPLYPPYLVHAASLGAAGGYVPPTDYSATLSDTILKDEITQFVTASLPAKVTTITETTLNYIDPNDFTVGIIQSTGVISANASYFTTGFIPVETGKMYTTNAVPIFAATYTAYYNKHQNLISASLLRESPFPRHIYDNRPKHCIYSHLISRCS